MLKKSVKSPKKSTKDIERNPRNFQQKLKNLERNLGRSSCTHLGRNSKRNPQWTSWKYCRRNCGRCVTKFLEGITREPTKSIPGRMFGFPRGGKNIGKIVWKLLVGSKFFEYCSQTLSQRFCNNFSHVFFSNFRYFIPESM